MIWVWVKSTPPILVHFSGDWDVHWGYGILTHGHVPPPFARVPVLGLCPRKPKRSPPFGGFLQQFIGGYPSIG